MWQQKHKHGVSLNLNVAVKNEHRHIQDTQSATVTWACLNEADNNSVRLYR